MSALTRRAFLKQGLGAAVTLGLPGCGPSPAPVPDDVLALHRDAVVLDLHVDTLLWMRSLGYDVARRHVNRLPGAPFAWHMDLPRAAEGGLDGGVMGLVINPREVRDELILPLKLLAWVEDGAGIEQTLATLDLFAEAADAHPTRLAFCRTGSEMSAAIATGRFAGLAGLEGSHGIESDMANVQAAYDRGLRMIGLTHFQASSAAYPMTVAAFDGMGLTDFGRDLVDEMQLLGMVVDLAHVTYAGVDEAIGRLSQPFVVSHSACRALTDSPRNLPDPLIGRIADAGGVIGMCLGRNFAGSDLADFVAHVEHALNVGGSDAVAIGSDWDGAIVPVSGLEDVRMLPSLTAALLERGHSEAVVRKVLGENALRVLTDVCG